MIPSRYLLLLFFSLIIFNRSAAQNKIPRFRVVALYENGGHHIAYSAAAKEWLGKLAADSNFVVDYITGTDSINDSFLSKYRLFIQLDYPPYNWNAVAVKAFQRYITTGKGGWIGFHHAALLGEFDGFPMWQWFSGFMGDIRYKDYIPNFADAIVHVEDTIHPCMQHLPAHFKIENEEWYTFSKSPRPNVKVLASVDEATYSPYSKIKMGDHPVVWTNTNYAARNIYIFMGHGPELFLNDRYTTIFRNAIFWAAGIKY